MILESDGLSYLNPKQQSALIAEFSEKIKDNGLIMLGKNEAMPQKSGWLRHVQGDIVAFSKE